MWRNTNIFQTTVTHQNCIYEEIMIQINKTTNAVSAPVGMICGQPTLYARIVCYTAPAVWKRIIVINSNRYSP
jgi:hypothetical protein